MAKTFSTMLPLGTQAPHFALLDAVSGTIKTLAELTSAKATVIMFICNHCPYVKLIQHKMAEVAKHYQGRGIAFIAISSNDVTNYPDDSPDKMKEEAMVHAYTFPYLYDETQAVAKAYNAECTPEFYIFDSNVKCVYRGRFDDATPGNGQPVTGIDLTLALDAILAHKDINQDQKPSVGCNIKWKK